jgi:outer membrane protein
MGVRTFLSFLCVLCALWVGGALSAQASADPAFPLAVIDVRALLAKSEAGKSLQAQIDQRREAFQKDFSDTEARLQKTGQEIAAQRSSLSPEDFAKKKKAFEDDFAKAKKRLEDRKQGLDKAFMDSVGLLRSKIVSISSDLARERGYRLVMTRENMVVVDKGLDVTEEVMARMNKALPDVKLKAAAE